MQMPRTIIAVEMVKEAGLPYFVLLTDPTTGGVSASFAMVGDIHLAEPGCMIGFAGKRVIQETIREELPPRFQTAEYLVDHGMVDMVVPRKELRSTFIRILGILFHKTARNAVKALRTTTEKSAAEALLPKVTAMLDKLAKHNIVHKNKAANLKSSIQLHVNAL